MQELAKNLREARLHASVRAMSQAERHIRAALKLFDAAPRRSLPPAVRGFILQAGRAVTRSDSRLALSALDEAILVLENLRSSA